jgi:hypothetical protein
MYPTNQLSLMILINFIVLSFYIVFLLQILFPSQKEEKKTPEQELGEAITKYLNSKNPPND